MPPRRRTALAAGPGFLQRLLRARVGAGRGRSLLLLVLLCGSASLSSCRLPRNQAEVMHGTVHGGPVPLYKTGSVEEFYRAGLILPDVGGYVRTEFDVLDVGDDGQVLSSTAGGAARSKPVAQVAIPRSIASYDLSRSNCEMRAAAPATDPASAGQGSPVDPVIAATSPPPPAPPAPRAPVKAAPALAHAAPVPPVFTPASIGPPIAGLLPPAEPAVAPAGDGPTNGHVTAKPDLANVAEKDLKDNSSPPGKSIPAVAVSTSGAGPAAQAGVGAAAGPQKPEDPYFRLVSLAIASFPQGN